MAYCPVAFMEQFLIVGPRALREGGQVQDFHRKAHGHIFPDARVKAAGAIEVPRVQGVNPTETLDTFFE